MSEFPSLAEVLDRHGELDECALCECGHLPEKSGVSHRQHQADAWREACTITTVEQLDALPFLSVVKEIRIAPSGSDLGAVWEKWRGGQWMRMGYGPLRGQTYDGPISLPALLIHNPDWSGS